MCVCVCVCVCACVTCDSHEGSIHVPQICVHVAYFPLKMLWYNGTLFIYNRAVIKHEVYFLF